MGCSKSIIITSQQGILLPKVNRKHVAVISEDGHLSAKIWNFSETENEEAMDGDWDRFANMIEKASKNHKIYSLEVSDLCTRMRKGELKGLEIFKHSAMLSAPKKRDQILALNGYARTFCGRPEKQNPFVNDPIKSQIHDELVRFLGEVSDWLTQSMPQWIKDVNDIRERKAPPVQNGLSLLYELRSMLEHANRYLPPSDPSQPMRSDLQEEFRKAWEEHLLKFHKFAADLQLEY